MNTKPEGTNTVTDRILKDYETCKLFNTLFCYPLFSKFTKSKNKQTNKQQTISGLPRWENKSGCRWQDRSLLTNNHTYYYLLLWCCLLSFFFLITLRWEKRRAWTDDLCLRWELREKPSVRSLCQLNPTNPSFHGVSHQLFFLAPSAKLHHQENMTLSILKTRQVTFRTSLLADWIQIILA